MNTFEAAIAEQITVATGSVFEVAQTSSCSGGCINQADTYSGKDGRAFFVKVNTTLSLDLFEAEASSLRGLEASNTMRVPHVVTLGEAEDKPFLVLEKLNLTASGNGRWMGEQLAAMHKVVGPYYGWERSNYIGATPQHNQPSECWIDFYREQRLEYQIKLAQERGLKLKATSKLLDNLDELFQGYDPLPSLLHGDLWGGNASFLESGEPVVFDPAAYYGDRETDLAFTYMFGGFGRDFYDAYETCYPIDAGFAHRKELYNLYHLLNHFNLFGGGYGIQAEETIVQIIKRSL